MRNITPDIWHTLGIDNELYNSVQGCGAKMSSHPVKDIVGYVVVDGVQGCGAKMSSHPVKDIIAVVDEQQLH